MDRIGAIIGAYDGSADNVGQLAHCLKEAGYYVVVGYDAVESLPSAQAVNSCDYFFSGGGIKGKDEGHAWAIRVGLGLLCDAKCNYVLSVTGDAIVKKPRHVLDLIEILGKNDVMASQWHQAVGTMVFFGKTWPMYRVFLEIHQGPPQIEKKFHGVLLYRKMSYIIQPCRRDDKGIWATIGYSRGRDNYMP